MMNGFWIGVVAARGAALAGGLLAVVVAPVVAADAAEEDVAREDRGFRPERLAALDAVIEDAVERDEIPGAVLWLESGGRLHHRASGNRALVPRREPMTPGTIFDVASLTKVLATAPAVMHLVERGKLDLDAPIARYLPEFAADHVAADQGATDQKAADQGVADPRGRVTLRHLLSHQSGLPAGIDRTREDFDGYAAGVSRAVRLELREEPGTVFRYSDVNFILLGEIVRRVAGRGLDVYVREHLFGPLGMKDTGFRPSAGLRGRIAPTVETAGGMVLRGVVHDPSAARMGGVAGHAGLFSTADDIATFLRMILAGGRHGGTRVLAAESVAEMTRNQLPAALGHRRGLGWDIDSPFAHPRGGLFPVGGFGHTGWTGTSLWVDPASRSCVILLTNRNHPRERKSIRELRKSVGTLAAEAIGYTEPAPPAVLNGIDVLERDEFRPLAGLRVGLVTNHTGINRDGRPTIDLLAGAPEVKLVALFSPEHGIRGELETDSIRDGRDALTGLPVFSLYQDQTRKPRPEHLENLDALVFDIQDIGCRFYTYISTMGLAMEAAAEAGKRLIVLDRVNPIGGVEVDGPVRAGAGNNFTAFHDIPVRHGMTAGELARMFRAERGVAVELTVIPVENWRPSSMFDETGLPWVNPSPNIRRLDQALLYPGIGLPEFTDISVGRGTDSPFEQVGAPWLDGEALAANLQAAKLPGLAIEAVRFTPRASVHAGRECGGVRFTITDRARFRPLDLGMVLMRALHHQHPDRYDLAAKGNVLLRHPPTLKRLLAGDALAAIRAGWEPELGKFKQRRAKFLLYPRE